MILLPYYITSHKITKSFAVIPHSGTYVYFSYYTLPELTTIREQKNKKSILSHSCWCMVAWMSWIWHIMEQGIACIFLKKQTFQDVRQTVYSNIVCCRFWRDSTAFVLILHRISDIVGCRYNLYIKQSSSG